LQITNASPSPLKKGLTEVFNIQGRQMTTKPTRTASLTLTFPHVTYMKYNVTYHMFE